MHDVAVVQQEGVGDAGQARQRLVVAVTSGSPPGLALVITRASACACVEPAGAGRPPGRFVEQQDCSGV